MSTKTNDTPKKNKTKNKLMDLNNHLFEQMERLNDDDLTDEELEREMKRADSMTKVAGQIIHNAELAYKVMVHMAEYGLGPGEIESVPAMLEMSNGN